MGLLDMTNDPESMGLLNAGLSMMGNSGPSLMPHSIGQIIAGGGQAGLQAMQQLKMQKQKEDEMAQLMKYRGLQMTGLQGDIDQHQMQRAEAQRLQKFMTDRANPQTQMQNTLGGDMSPTVANADKLTAAQVASNDPYQSRMALANDLYKNNFPTQAEAQETSALKFKPKFANEPRTVMGPDGKPMLVQMADDGTVRPIQGGYGVAEKLVAQDLGGKTGYVNPFTGVGVANTFVAKTMTPDAIASNSLGWANHNNTVNNQNAPSWNNEVGAFVTKPSAQNPNGVMTNLAGYMKPDKPLTESQGNSLGFGMRAKDAQDILTGLEANNTKNGGVFKTAMSNVPFIGSSLSSAINVLPGSLGGPSGSQQSYDQSKRNFVSAVLRKESGAAISPEEFKMEEIKYFPQPGDTKLVQDQKSRARDMAVQALEFQAGRKLPTFPQYQTAEPTTSNGAGNGKWSIEKAN